MNNNIHRLKDILGNDKFKVDISSSGKPKPFYSYLCSLTNESLTCLHRGELISEFHISEEVIKKIEIDNQNLIIHYYEYSPNKENLNKTDENCFIILHLKSLEEL